MFGGYRTPAKERMSVVYLGESTSLQQICTWGEQHGIAAVDGPDDDALCAVVDEGLLDGPTTSLEDEILRRVRRAGLPCFTPARAWPFLSSAVNRGLCESA